MNKIEQAILEVCSTWDYSVTNLGNMREIRTSISKYGWCVFGEGDSFNPILESDDKQKIIDVFKRKDNK